MATETIADVIREMRGYAADMVERYNTAVEGDKRIDCNIIACRMCEFAVRIKQAHERERESTCEKSSQVGSGAKMREALKYLRDASREFHHLILNSKHNEICDKYKYAEVAKISDAIANANAALSEPPRNCDRYPTLAAALDAWREVDPRDAGTFDEWIFAEKKGESK